MERRDFLIGAGALPIAASLPGRADAHVGIVLRAFADTDALAAYTRLSALRQPLLVADRGGAPGRKGIFPPGAIETAERLLHQGPAFIKLEIRVTRDGVPVVLFSDDLAAVTSGTGKVAETDWATISDLALKDTEGRVTPFAPLRLVDWLDWSAGGVNLWLDPKDIPPEQLVDVIRAAGAEARVIVGAYGAEPLRRYVAAAPDLVYFVPLIPPRGLPDLESVFATGLDPARMIGFAGWYVPDMRNAILMARQDIPALLDVSRGDRKLAPKDLDARLYEAAEREGFPLIATAHAGPVARLLGLSDWQ